MLSSRSQWSVGEPEKLRSCHTGGAVSKRSERAVRLGGASPFLVALAGAATIAAAAAAGGNADGTALHPEDETAASSSVDELQWQYQYRGQRLEVGGFDAGETVAAEHEDDAAKGGSLLR